MRDSFQDGTLLLFGVTYPRSDKVWTYALLKAGGRWYGSGTGRVPQDAGWGAIERWIRSDDREVRWVKLVTETVQVWPVAPSLPASASLAISPASPDHPENLKDGAEEDEEMLGEVREHRETDWSWLEGDYPT